MRAGSHEIATFNIDLTPPRPGQRMGRGRFASCRACGRRVTHYEGEHFSVERPHNILPEAIPGRSSAAVGRVRQPFDVRQGRSVRHRALGFNFSPIHDMRQHID